MHFFRSLKSVDAAHAKQKADTDDAVKKINEPVVKRTEQLQAQANKVEQQLQDFVAGATPADAVDLAGFKKFLKVQEEQTPTHGVLADSKAG